MACKLLVIINYTHEFIWLHRKVFLCHCVPLGLKINTLGSQHICLHMCYLHSQQVFLLLPLHKDPADVREQTDLASSHYHCYQYRWSFTSASYVMSSLVEKQSCSSTTSTSWALTPSWKDMMSSLLSYSVHNISIYLLACRLLWPPFLPYRIQSILLFTQAKGLHHHHYPLPRLVKCNSRIGSSNTVLTSVVRDMPRISTAIYAGDETLTIILWMKH